MTRDNIQITTRNKLWLNSTWYIEVDNDGYLLSKCAEGALGYVIQCQSEAKQTSALKLPRLRGDSVLENAEYCNVLSREAMEVLKVDAARIKDGLVRLLHPNQSILYERHNLQDSYSTKHQHDYTLLFCFEKDRPVRIAKIKFDGIQLLVFPSSSDNLKKELENAITKADWDALTTGQDSAPLDINRREPLLFTVSVNQRILKEVDDISKGRLLSSELSSRHPPAYWYLWLPSLMFEWAEGTLQSSIHNNEHKKWKLYDIYTVLTNLLQGLKSLHELTMIHGDVRPANIMACGSMSDPACYRLGDYGSFSVDLPTASTGSGVARTGHSAPPSVTRHRSSSFYARERRSGVEREDADVAVLVSILDKGEPSLLLVLTWKRLLPMIDDTVGWKARLEDYSQLHSEISGQKHDPLTRPWELGNGDQIRVRDLVFTVRSYSDKPETNAIYVVCDPRCRRIMNERVVVELNEPLFINKYNQNIAIIDIPRWIEVRQASVASDMFGVGSVSLFVAYSIACVRKGVSPISAQQHAIDSAVGDLIAKLENEKNFQNLWIDIRRICGIVEMAFCRFNKFQVQMQNTSDADLSNAICELILSELNQRSQDVKTVKSSKKDKNSPASKSNSDLFSTFRSSYQALRKALIYWVPELEIVFKNAGNSIHLFMFIEFVLCCLHRRTHLGGLNNTDTPPALWKSEEVWELRKLEPFCENRFESPRRDQLDNRSGTAVALERLKILRDHYLSNNIFFDTLEKMIGEPTEASQTPKTDYEIRKENATLQQDIQGLREQLSSIEKEKSTISEDYLLQLKNQRENNDRSISKLTKELTHERAEKETLQKSETDKSNVINVLLAKLNEKESTAINDSAEFDHLRNQIVVLEQRATAFEKQIADFIEKMNQQTTAFKNEHPLICNYFSSVRELIEHIETSLSSYNKTKRSGVTHRDELRPKTDPRK